MRTSTFTSTSNTIKEGTSTLIMFTVAHQSVYTPNQSVTSEHLTVAQIHTNALKRHKRCQTTTGIMNQPEITYTTHLT